MIINVYKDKNMTSRDVVNILVKHFKTKKIGHTGTLDPIATGVLICVLGSDTKFVDILQSKTKEYIATIKLGVKTDTGDITGKVIDTRTYRLDRDTIVSCLATFKGTYLQEVPIYSAVKIKGKKLYDYARNNEEVILPKRMVTIYDIELLDYHDDLIKFKVTVSKGTYIRSLIADICTKLKTVGTMAELTRTKQGEFKIEDSNKLKDILDDHYQIISYDDIFKSYETIELNDSEYFKVKNGQVMPINFKNKEVIYKYQNKYIALYENINNEARLKILFK